MIKINQLHSTSKWHHFKNGTPVVKRCNSYSDHTAPAFFFSCKEIAWVIDNHKGAAIIILNNDPRNLESCLDKVRLRKDIYFISTSSLISNYLDRLKLSYIEFPFGLADRDNIKPIKKGNSIYFYGQGPMENIYGYPVIKRIVENHFPHLNIICTQYQDTVAHLPFKAYLKSELEDVYKKCFIGVRLTQFDGLSSTVQDLGYVSTESRLTDIRETPPEPTSIKNLEQDDTLVSDILQYRKDRYGQALDAKSDNILFGKLFGGQELTNENVVDDFMDNYRFISGNSLDAATEISWLKSLQQKEEEASKLGTEEGVKKANQYAEQRERALRLYQRADSVRNIFDSKRYEGMNALATVADIADNVGGNVLAALTDPLTALTAGIGRAVTGTSRALGVSPFRQALKAAGITFGIEAAGAAVTDIMVQGAEVEMGAKKEIDYGRTVTVAGIGGLTAGTISGIGKYNAEKKIGIATRGELDEAWKKVREEQTESALKKNLELGVQSDDIRENLAKGITNIYGEKAIIRYTKGPKKGKIKGIDSEVIKQSDKAKGFFKNMNLDEDVIEPTISFDIFERTTAAVSEIVAGLKDKTLKLVDDPEVIGDGVTLKSLTSPLQAKERVSERLLNITSNMSEESLDQMTSIMGKYGVTRREIAAALFTDASMAGKTLGNLSALQKNFTKAARRKTSGEVAEQAESEAVDRLDTNTKKTRRHQKINIS